MTTIYTTRADSKPFDVPGPTTGPKKTVQLPGGLRTLPPIAGSTAGLYWLDEFPPALFPAGSIERHDAEHYGVVIPLRYLNYRFEPPYARAQWIAPPAERQPLAGSALDLRLLARRIRNAASSRCSRAGFSMRERLPSPL